MSFTSRNTPTTAFPMLDFILQMQQIGLQAMTMFRPMGFGVPGFATGSREDGFPRPFQTGAGSMAQTARAAHDAHEEHVVPVGEEVLNVGTRLVPGKTTRVRRIVVQTPVEQEVTLHTETVVLERRKPIGTIGNDILTEVTVEMSDFNEVPVVSKGVRLVEEVLLRKEVTARTETIRDTLKRDKLEIEQPSQLPALFAVPQKREEPARTEQRAEQSVGDHQRGNAKLGAEDGGDAGQGKAVMAPEANQPGDSNSGPQANDKSAAHADRKGPPQAGQKR